MPSFSERSIRNLETCHEDLQILFLQVIRTYDCSIICGHRGEEDQEKAVRDGFSKVNFPDSKHNEFPSMAVDVIPYPVDWGDIHRFYHFAGYVMGVAERLQDEHLMGHGLRWGGDWRSNMTVSHSHDQTFMDYPHFELTDG